MNFCCLEKKRRDERVGVVIYRLEVYNMEDLWRLAKSAPGDAETRQPQGLRAVSLLHRFLRVEDHLE